MINNRISSSFRDPSGYVFRDGDKIRRTITPLYFRQYNSLTQKGIYEELFRKKFLISHHEISNSPESIIIEPKFIPFITYPYEWSFLQYKHAALLTLKIQKYCLGHNFTLKDASAFNVTFFDGKPIFIDTLSFDFYEEGTPWMAYKQFITHFLGPLLLSSYFGSAHLKTLSTYIDGIPIDALSKLLPLRSYFSPVVWANVHMLARFENKKKGIKSEKDPQLSKAAQLRLLDGLYDFIENLDVSEKTEWDQYYSEINYDQSSHNIKKDLVKGWAVSLPEGAIIDIGGNDGTFSRQLLSVSDLLIVADIDANSVGKNYEIAQKNKERQILPVVIDLYNPSAAIGFSNSERFSFLDRLKQLRPVGCLALAVIHHITLSGNVPFALSAAFFAEISTDLLIEFPTPEDSWVQFLLDSKRQFRSHFDHYNEKNFEEAYSSYFDIVTKEIIPNTSRILYSMRRQIL
jgi:hypothetical protein